MKNIKDTIQKLSHSSRLMSQILNKIDNIQMALGRIELRQLESKSLMNISDNEFKVYSQNGEDGIIQYLIRHVDIPNKIFVEFGVHNYLESNTRFLLQNNNWAGLVMDGSSENISFIKKDSFYWMYNIKAERAFIDRDNINSLLENNGIRGDIGLLSIDIDGNDYWVWKAINSISPRIVVIEYNSIYGDSKKVTIPYDPTFNAYKAHYSGLYWGASIAALNHLADSKGYSLVGSNKFGNNLFFVRKDIIGAIPHYSPRKAYVKAQFRISRDESGELNHIGLDEGRRLIAHLTLQEIENSNFIKVGELDGK